MYGVVGSSAGCSHFEGATKESCGDSFGKLLGGTGGLDSLISKLFGGSQHPGCNEQTAALLGDIKNVLTQLLNNFDQKGGQCHGGPNHGGHGHYGNDHMHGGKGRDHMDGGYGNDHMHGGKGHDHMDGGYGNDHMHGGKGRDHMDGGYGNDHMHGGKGRDHMDGGYGNDHMYGGKGRDHMDGGCGNDHMHGGKGHDHMDGGHGNDHMHGGRGNDRLYGGSGHNHLNGGKGNDIYVIANSSDNVISDSRGRDTIKMDGNQSDYDMDRDGNDLIIKSHDGKTSVTVKDHYSGSSIEAVQFDDGKVTNFSFHENCGS